MRLLVVLALLTSFGVPSAHAGGKSSTPTIDKALRPYAGKLVIAVDEPPRELDKLAGFLKTSVAKDARYEAWKGPPWRFYLVSWFGKPVTGDVTVVIVDKADPKAAPMLSAGFALVAGNRLLWAQVDANASTGFEAGKTYVVRMLVGTKLVASSQLVLRE